MRTLLAVSAAMLVFALPVHANPPSQAKHDAQIAAFFRSHPKLARTPAGQLALLQIQVRQLDARVRSLQSARRILTPAETRTLVYRTDPCLANIMERESAHTWDPTIDYGMGHGNVYEAYGIGQANPGTKMSPFGPDWRTNPRTQLRWAVSYANGTYGSTCAAWSYWQVHHAW